MTRDSQRKLVLWAFAASMTLGAAGSAASTMSGVRLAVVLVAAGALALLADRAVGPHASRVQSHDRRDRVVVGVVALAGLIGLMAASGVAAALWFGLVGGVIVGVLRRVPMKPTSA